MARNDDGLTGQPACQLWPRDAGLTAATVHRNRGRTAAGDGDGDGDGSSG